MVTDIKKKNIWKKPRRPLGKPLGPHGFSSLCWTCHEESPTIWSPPVNIFISVRNRTRTKVVGVRNENAYEIRTRNLNGLQFCGKSVIHWLCIPEILQNLPRQLPSIVSNFRRLSTIVDASNDWSILDWYGIDSILRGRLVSQHAVLMSDLPSSKS